jgi:sulfatase modifying factor 1
MLFITDPATHQAPPHLKIESNIQFPNIMKTISRALWIAALSLLFSSLASAEVPSLINYQGRLINTNGAPVTGTKSFSISLYNAQTGGTAVYTENIGNVTLDANGLYNFEFGANTEGMSAALALGSQHWIEIGVDGVSQGNRERILAVPFAMRAEASNDTEKLIEYLRGISELFPNPSFNQQPSSTTITSGETATLSVVLYQDDVGGGAAFTEIQWYRGESGDVSNPILGANSRHYTTEALDSNESYWARASFWGRSADSETATITVVPLPLISSFTANPTTITAGNTSTLSWSVSGATSLSISSGVGDVTGVSSITTNPNDTTTYMLTATNAAGDSVTAPVTVSVEMALIPAGSFMMGDTMGDGGDSPVTVNVSAFYIGKYEVTKTLWDEVRTWGASNGYTDLSTGGGKANNHPVHTISWFDMVKWCNARSQKEGLTPVYTVSGLVMKTGTSAPTANWSANGYRLPTEAEWEKAARGGLSGKRFPWGDAINHDQSNFQNNGGEAYQSGTTGYHPLYSTGLSPYTSAVGSFPANGYGIYDMAGNLREWCWDKDQSSSYPVLRGGSWGSGANICRIAFRFSIYPFNGSHFYGFRVARSSVP